MSDTSAVEALAPIDVGAIDVDSAMRADVVVVGLGIAGASAALSAAAAGARVTVVERASGGGGLSASSGGVIYLGGGTRLQRACGFEDRPEWMEAYLEAALGPSVDRAKLAVYCAESIEHFDWFERHGVPFEAAFWDEPNKEPATTAGLNFSGGEDAAPHGHVAPAVPRGHHPAVAGAAGAFLMRCLLDALAATNSIEVVTDARVDHLVVDPDADGRVCGIQARTAEGPRTVVASGGVVLAAGGFTANRDMLGIHCRDVLRTKLRLRTDGDDGRAIRMGLGVGAAVGNMAGYECAIPITPPRKLVEGIIVDATGQRFVNEDAYLGTVGHACLRQADGQAFMVLDDEAYEVNEAFMEATWVADDARGLAVELGIDATALAATVDDYNAGADAGIDPLGKAPTHLRRLVPPFGAIDLRVDHAIYATFTLGGLVTDPDGAVMSTTGSAVPGLWAAGRTTFGLAAEGYVSGISLGDGSFFGRRAGAAAAGTQAG